MFFIDITTIHYALMEGDLTATMRVVNAISREQLQIDI